MKITIVTTMRNEGPHILEWVAHHVAAGVSNFLVFTNDCSDGTQALLDLLPCVTHVPLFHGDKPPQWRALKAAWDHPLVKGADWLMCLDCDEFINLSSDLRSISHLIDEVNADAILMPWRLFGNNGHIEVTNAPTTQRFTKAAPPNMLYPAIGSYFKTLFRRAGPFRQFGVHRPKQKKPDKHPLARWSNGSGREITGKIVDNDNQILYWGEGIERDLVQLNHYSVRSAAEYMVKRDRGLPNHTTKEIGLTYWVERNFNSVEDKTIQSMTSATEETLQELKSISGVFQAHQKTQEWHKKRFGELLKSSEELALFGRLILAGSSAPPERDQALALVRAYQVANAG